ncbi:hypothetical protein Dsin_032563 [Dipteronia sinensis]|uniref:Flavin-containing monooxygenase n=1 Tax=Dipteronia sinensis TaxID=43782 RepID=A0AAD9ZBS8_9ROSI|nr:hypothetical protein Dsin_032563 [Dipteronia sinensis]
MSELYPHVSVMESLLCDEFLRKESPVVHRVIQHRRVNVVRDMVRPRHNQRLDSCMDESWRGSSLSPPPSFTRHNHITSPAAAMNTANSVDMAIVGAVNPRASMAILDTAAAIGGVWAKQRLYPGLKTNNLLGSYEFSDFPMGSDRFNVKPGQHIPGTAVYDYLNGFAEAFGLMPFMQLQQRVESAELLPDGTWSLRIVAVSGGTSFEPRVLICRRLVVATGLTSQPSMPTFAGQNTFHRPLFHAKELRLKTHIIENSRKIAVLGGNKSAWDACYHAAKNGVHVHMVIRPSGGGPSFVWPAFFSPFRVSIQRLATTRFFTWFDPCIWGERSGIAGGIRHFLHKTWIGRKVVSGFWTSIHNYTSSWFELVRDGKISVHIADIDSMSEGTLHLSNGEALQVDALVSCTGWKSSLPFRFLPEEVTSTVSCTDLTVELMAECCSDILTNAPILRRKPDRTLPPGSKDLNVHMDKQGHQVSDRYQLYRFLIPTDTRLVELRNIAFIGFHLALSAVMVAQVQALWITAYMLDEIPNIAADSIDRKRILYETILHNDYSRLRHPRAAGGAGDKYPDLAFECLPYLDLLLDDLRLPKYRKSSFWSETFQRYTPKDYRGIVQEWLATRKRGRLSCVDP